MENKSKTMSVIALICGILAILTCGCCFPCGIIAVILAIIVLVKNKGGKVMAIIGMVLSIISGLIISLFVITFMPMKDAIMELANDPEYYIEQYEENGTYPEFVEKLADMSNLTGDKREQTMKEFMDAFIESYEKNSAR